LTFSEKSVENKDMQKVSTILLFMLLGLSSAHAQELEFEAIRTLETPGFFMVRVFPGENSIPLPLQDVYVANYKKAEEAPYKELFSVVREMGGKVVPGDEIEKYSASKHNRIIMLGDPKGDFLNFHILNPKKTLEEFEEFARKNLGPVLLENVVAKFGGNVSEVFPAKIEKVGFEPVFFVGKIERPMKTHMEISGVSSEGEIRAIAALHFEDDTTARGPLTKELPNIWEELWRSSQSGFSIPVWTSFLADNIFPGVLLLLGILIIVLALRANKKEKKADKNVEAWVDLAPDQWSGDVPFEIEKKKRNDQ